MDNINKIISFILGLIVVVVFIAIVTGRFKVGNGIKNIAKSKVTPTVTQTHVVPTKAVTITYNNTPANAPIISKTTVPVYNTTTQIKYKTTQTPGTTISTVQVSPSNLSTIPNTGAPTFLLPTALSMLGGGVLLKRKSNKK